MQPKRYATENHFWMVLEGNFPLRRVGEVFEDVTI